MSDMSFGKKILFCLCGALAASSIAGFVYLLFIPQARSLVAVISVASLICAILFFVVNQILKDRNANIRIIAQVAAGFVSILVIFSSVIITLAPLAVFPCNHDEKAYDKLTEISEKEGSRVSEIKIDDLTGWRISSRNAKDSDPRQVVVCFVGNGMNSAHTTLMVYEDKDNLFGEFTENTDFVCIDYPGYGISGGTPNGESVREMSLEVYDEVASWETTSGIILFGYSIGTGAAAYAASERDAEGLVLWAPYANAYDLFNSYINVFHGPLRLLVTFHMDSDKYIKKVTCPVLIIASDQDEIVPYQSSRNLFAAANGSASDFVTVSEIGHNDFWSEGKVLDNTFDFIGEVA